MHAPLQSSCSKFRSGPTGGSSFATTRALIALLQLSKDSKDSKDSEGWSRALGRHGGIQWPLCMERWSRNPGHLGPLNL